MKKIFKILVLVLFLGVCLCFTGCRKAENVNYNLKKEADYFNVYRKMTFINLRTDKILYTAEGYFSLSDSSTNEIALTFRCGKDSYKINYFGIGDGVTYIIEQLEDTHTSPYFYEIKIYGVLPKFETDNENEKDNNPPVITEGEE